MKYLWFKRRWWNPVRWFKGVWYIMWYNIKLHDTNGILRRVK